MTKHIEQAKHNETFHDSLCTSFNDKYFDWKIICLFYSAFHLLQAYASLKGKDIGHRHHDMLWNINPKNSKRPLQVKNNIFEAYDALFEYSRSARYDGFTDLDDFEILKKEDYKYALRNYEYIKNYVVSNGVTI